MSRRTSPARSSSSRRRIGLRSRHRASRRRRLARAVSDVVDETRRAADRARAHRAGTPTRPSTRASAARRGLSVVEITFDRCRGRGDSARLRNRRSSRRSGHGPLTRAARPGAGCRCALRRRAGTNDAVVEAARSAGVPFVPGVATPSEIEHARSLGCRELKVFPASVVGGPAFLKAVAPVYPDVRFVPTGGSIPRTSRPTSSYRRCSPAAARGSASESSWTSSASTRSSGGHGKPSGWRRSRIPA